MPTPQTTAGIRPPIRKQLGQAVKSSIVAGRGASEGCQRRPTAGPSPATDFDDTEALSGDTALRVRAFWLLEAMIEAEAWGNPNGDGYGHDGDMKAATAFETLAKAYWLLGGTKEALEWRPQIVGKLEWQGKRFVELVQCFKISVTYSFLERLMRIAHIISPSPEDQQWLRKQVSSTMTSRRLDERCRIVLLATEGQNNEQIATALSITRQKAARWRTRFIKLGRAGLEADAPGRGRKPVYGPEMHALIVERTLRTSPSLATHWSQRSLAKALEVSDSTVGRVWRAHGLKPHLARTFKVSNDPASLRSSKT